MTTETASDIRGFLEDSFPNLSLTDEDDIFELGVVNSLFVVQLVMFLERHFALTIPNEELERGNFQTISAMSKLVERISAPDTNGR